MTHIKKYEIMHIEEKKICRHNNKWPCVAEFAAIKWRILSRNFKKQKPYDFFNEYAKLCCFH